VPRHRNEEGAIGSRANGVFDAIVKHQDVAGGEIHRPRLGPRCEPAAENLDRDLAVHVVLRHVRPFSQRDHRDPQGAFLDECLGGAAGPRLSCPLKQPVQLLTQTEAQLLS